MADFVLGRIKFVWKGNWATGTSYIKDDVVRYGGNTFVATVNHTASTLFETDLSAAPAKWEKMAAGFDFKGTYVNDSSTYYKVDDVVKYGSSLWICTVAHYGGATLDETKFSAFTDGLEFENTYSSSTAYQSGDIVTYGGYSYVAEQQSTGQTPYNNTSYWKVLSTGFKLQGTWASGTAYKTGDVVKYGGNTYVFKVDTSAGNKPTNTSYADLLVEGISLQGTWSSGTSYLIGQTVIYQNSSYRAIRDNSNKTPSTETADWAQYNIGDASGILSARGDLLTRDANIPVRLPVGPAGSYLVTDGTDVKWAEDNVGVTYYVSPNGSDSNPGTRALPFRTIQHASKQTNVAGISGISNISGGTGGTPGTYDVTGASGSGAGATLRVTTDGSSTPTVKVKNAGYNYTAGGTFTVQGSNLGSSSNLTFTIDDVTYGDKIFCEHGEYSEVLPIQLKTKTMLEGSSLRGCRVTPASGTGTQIATVTNVGANDASRTAGTYTLVQGTSSGDGVGARFTIVVDGSSAISVTCTHGGSHYAVNETITIADSVLGNGGGAALTFQVATLKNNNVSEMFLVNDATNIRNFTFAGLTTGGRVFALDPSGAITTASPYIQNCTSVNSNATGIYIDGKAQSSGNKSMLANDFTQINSDGTGVHVLNRGRCELVSVFTYYCDKAILAESGGFVRALNSSMAYGEYGAYATGTDPDETAISVLLRGEMVVYSNNIGTNSIDDGDTLTGQTSGATANVINHVADSKHVKIESRVGNFTQGETVTVTNADSSTFTITLSSSEGDSTAAQIGQKGKLIEVKSTDSTLASSNVLKPRQNIQFAGDSTIYTIGAVTEEDTSAKTALVRLVTEKTSSIAEGAAATVTTNYSNIRLTGHDFLDIGTGGIVDTNYPNVPSQLADQGREVTELLGARVYFTSTDQDGDFRVGDLFRVEQATGVATLNADAFDLSGLTELQLGSIGAQIGATINEFSTDGTLAGNSDTAVPTEQAVKTYVTANSFSTGKAIAMSIVFG